MKYFCKEEKKKIERQKSRFRLGVLGYLIILAPIAIITYNNFKLKPYREKEVHKLSAPQNWKPVLWKYQ